MKRLSRLNIQNCKSLVELSGLESLESLNYLGIDNCNGLRIPLIEKWFKARSKGDIVQIVVGASSRGEGFCRFPTPWGDVTFEIPHDVIDPCSKIEGIDLSVRRKSSGAWILRMESPRIFYYPAYFEVPTMMGEVLEV
ncbi:PREDICTED: uncharacterized protein LOC109146781 [Ipomoea nil]|uniref:uncharacterized protein LOC109146781 n=1 Tax=Ipomoea nil TaxID=35883 RepID=UPI000901F49D|nr:PREDICTED: uncharacterized protein LOC109146781 [Ipomoea nil]